MGAGIDLGQPHSHSPSPDLWAARHSPQLPEPQWREGTLDPISAISRPERTRQKRQMQRMALTPDEIDRYKRHLVLREVGGQGQQKIKAAKVLVVGAGGLGSPLLMYLAAAGVGTIGVVDNDRVDLTNLQRQIVHATARVGDLKVDSARDALRAINDGVTIEAHAERLGPDNAEAMI